MKAKITASILAMVLFSIGGLAQKSSHKLFPSRNYSSTRLKAQENKLKELWNTVDHIHWSQAPSPDKSHLKAEPVAPVYSEKMDSLYSYQYDIDSMKMVISDAEYYEYDALGRNYLVWDALWQPQLGVLIPDDRTDVIWNSENQIARFTNSQWIDTSSLWLPNYRNSFLYDGDGNQTLMVAEDWNEISKSWYYSSVDTMFYTGTGKRWKGYNYDYDTISKTWNPQYYDLSTYDTNDFLIRQNSYNWVVDTSARWENNSESVYYNDEMGRDTTIINYYWTGLSWYQSNMKKTAYDARGNLIMEETWYWNGEMTDWYGSYRDEFIYDGNDMLEQQISYDWDDLKLDWYIFNRVDYIRDGNGNALEENEYLYDTTQQIFILLNKEMWTYDLSKDMTEIAMPYWWYGENIRDQGSDFINKVISYTDLIWDTIALKFDTSAIDAPYYSGLYESPVNEDACRANFSWILDEKDDKTVYFSDQSDTTVVAWYWMLGDGRISTRQNPVHSYVNPGTYKVVLTTTDETGFCSNTIIKQIKVGSPPCNAAFSYLVDTVEQVVTITNQSEGSGLNYFWSFGEGSVSKLKDPVHTYEYPGSYQIILTVIDGEGSCMDKYSATVQVGSIDCNADFVAYVDSSSNTAIFRVRQVNPQHKYHWVLGDGAVSNIANHPHRFSHPGYYTATLIVSNNLAGCVDKVTKTLLIGKQSPGGKADFIYVAGDENNVTFTNRSIGSELSYLWNFNDTETSEDKDPAHTFALPGYYNVCLTITTKDGIQNTHCERIFAGADTKDQCLARFRYSLSDDGLKIACTDRSFGNPDKWKWTFGDEDNESVPDPTWQTTEPDYVKIQLSILNSSNGCRDDAFSLVNMGAESKLQAGFGYTIDTSNTKADTYPVDFIGVSLGDAGKMRWSFGDGTYDSTTINPTHIYSQSGSYQVCLTITNSSTGKQSQSCEILNLGVSSLDQDLRSSNIGLKSYPNPFNESTKIEVRMHKSSDIDLSVYDLMGRKIKTIENDYRPAGRHTFQLVGSEIPAGNYYLILKTELGTERQLVSIVR